MPTSGGAKSIMPFNNAAERAIRPLVIGRRNWTFAGSDRGAENAATIMTTIETAKLCGLNPQT